MRSGRGHARMAGIARAKATNAFSLRSRERPKHQPTRQLNLLIAWHTLPDEIVLDNGTEFTSKAMFLWSLRTGV